MNENSISLIEAAQGAIKELIDVETGKIVENIYDPNTKAEKKRVLTIKVEFTPNSDRSYVNISATADSKLQPYAPVQTAIQIGADQSGELQAVELVPNIPGQMNFNGEEQPEPKQIKVTRKIVAE